MCTIAVLGLTLVHPGLCVPSLQSLQRRAPLKREKVDKANFEHSTANMEVV